MNNWIEMSDGDGNVMSVRTQDLVAVQRVGSELTFCYLGSAFPTVKLMSESAARAAYDSLLAQLRGQQTPPKLSKALRDMLADPGPVQPLPSVQPIPPVAAPHIDGCPCEECVALRTPKHVAQCPCEDCAERRTKYNQAHVNGCYCRACVNERACAAPKDYVEPPKPQPAALLHAECKCGQCEKNRKQPPMVLTRAEAILIAEGALEDAGEHIPGGGGEWHQKLVTSVMLGLQQRGLLPVQPAAVPSEEEMLNILMDAESDVNIYGTGRTELVARSLRRQLLERMPKREELTQEQVNEIAARSVAYSDFSTDSPKTEERWTRNLVRSVLKILKEQGRLL